jgi:hypothetical protein
MRFKSISVTIVALTSLIVLIGCNNTTYNGVKFNKSQWDSIGDIHSHPNRENMLEDLMDHDEKLGGK